VIASGEAYTGSEDRSALFLGGRRDREASRPLPGP
jgi:hypothetical protein